MERGLTGSTSSSPTKSQRRRDNECELTSIPTPVPQRIQVLRDTRLDRHDRFLDVFCSLGLGFPRMLPLTATTTASTVRALCSRAE